MQPIVIFSLIVALLLSVSIAYFQYYFKEKSTHKSTVILLSLRTLSVFLLLALLINPKIEKTLITNEKPILSLITDNSKSIAFFNETQTVNSILENLTSNSKLTEKFFLQKSQFGKQFQITDSLSFAESETNIYEAISQNNQLNTNKIAPIILMTDGNQTIGSDYEFLNSKKPIYPIILGDTTHYADVKIVQINNNSYSFLNNQFPVEVLLTYEGKENVTNEFKITSQGKTIFREKVSFSAQKKSAIISTNITSTEKGVHFYTASIEKMANEKNVENNRKSFSVEVIDEQTKVLIISSILHPDLGALKKSIESNKQRSVTISLAEDVKFQVNDFQLIILYQVTNRFKKIVEDIRKIKSPYFFISGANTDWNFVNNQPFGFTKRAINQTENYTALYNDSYANFLQPNIGFADFPPLKDAFGEVIFNKEYQTMLFQSINGIQTTAPLLATADVDEQKIATLFGEGLWRWRAESFFKSNTFEDFDAFIGNLVGYLASNKKRSRLEVRPENLYPANATINISAFYADNTYKFDPRASLEITLVHETTKEVLKFPFSLVSNSYQVRFENLASGTYDFEVTVLGQNLTKKGRFVITDYEIEAQFSRANVEKLQKLAVNSGGKLYYKDQLNELINDLSENDSFYTIQKSTTKQENLLDWPWILFVIIVLFTSEWFIRKYMGKI